MLNPSKSFDLDGLYKCSIFYLEKFLSFNQKIRNKSIFSEDGIWIYSRLLVGQIGQIFVAILTAYGLIYLTIDMCDTFENAREAVKDVALSIEPIF